MASDASLRSAMLWLAVTMAVVGICTLSLKKVLVTYVFGMLGIGGLLLPDWDFFDRDFSRWCYPITAEERAAVRARRSGFRRYRIYPIRAIVYAAIYGFGLYKWWMLIST